MTLYDVDFLKREPLVDRSIIYRYRTGILATKVQGAIEKALVAQGRGLSATPPEAFLEQLYGMTLFDEYVPICHWPKRKSRVVAGKAAAIVARLHDDDVTPGVIFAHVEDSIFEQPGWLNDGRYLVIEEPVVSAETMDSVLNYCFLATDLPWCPLQKAEVRVYFTSLLERDGDLALDEFRRVFDEAMLLNCAGTGAFLPPPATELVPGTRSYIALPLRRLVETRQVSAIDELVRGLEIRLRKRSIEPVVILEDLYHATLRVLAKGRDDGNAGDSRRDDIRKEWENQRHVDCVLWTCVLLAWSARLYRAEVRSAEVLLPQPDPILALFDQLARDFYRRVTRRDQANPIADLWRDIAEILHFYAQDGLGTPSACRDRVIVALSNHIDRTIRSDRRPIWVERLHRAIITAIDRRKHTDELEVDGEAA